MRRVAAALTLAAALTACGVSKEVYLQKEAEVTACRTDLLSRESALAEAKGQLEARGREVEAGAQELSACRRGLDAAQADTQSAGRKLATCLAEKDALQRAECEAELSRQKAQAAACAEARGKAEADLAGARGDLDGCRGENEAARREIDALKQRETELRARLEKEIQEQTVEIANLKARLSVRVVDRILFDSGRADILPAGREVLDKVASVVAGTGEQIRVEGHTDDVPVSRRLKPKFFSNWELSAARAANVVRYLEYGKGIEPARMEAVGLAHYRPDVPNDSFEGRAQNRRVVILLSPPRQVPSSSGLGGDAPK